MGYHPRIECKNIATFQTTRTASSKLWFVNNRKLEEEILGRVAKYAKRYGVKLYAFAIEGNHIQFPAMFPNGNRAQFMRDLNSYVSRSVARHQPNFCGGRLWARRYSAEYLPDLEDIEEQFFYTVLQPVQDGLVDDISEYPGYNCFEDAVRGTTRTYKVVSWKEYNDAKRWDPSVSIEDFTELYDLKYERLPGYEELSQGDYERILREKLRVRTAEIISKRAGKKSFGRDKLKKVVPGALPKKSKQSGRYDHRPRILSKDNERRAEGKAWYFSIYYRYREASEDYRMGKSDYQFPEGTYKPPTFTVMYEGSVYH